MIEMLIDHKHLCLAMEVIGSSQLQRACCDAQASASLWQISPTSASGTYHRHLPLADIADISQNYWRDDV